MKDQQQKQTRVGVAAIVRNEKGELLLGLRTGKHANGTWGFPGGHLEFRETPEDCVQREVKEETGLEVLALHKADYTSDYYKDEEKHYITLFYSVTCTGNPKVCEPDKCAEWKWFHYNDLPENVMLPIQHLLEQSPHIFEV